MTTIRKICNRCFLEGKYIEELPLGKQGFEVECSICKGELGYDYHYMGFNEGDVLPQEV